MIDYIEKDGMWYTVKDGQPFMGNSEDNARTLLRKMKRHGIPGLRRVIDCGGWIGQWSLMHSHAQHIETFEPNPEIQPLLEHNIKHLAHCPRHHVALSDKPGHTALRYTDSSHTGTCHMWEDGHTADIEVRTLDSYQFTDVDIIKIDVEGMEIPLLYGAEETIRSNRPWIMIEGNATARRYGRHKADTMHLLKEWGAMRIYKKWPDSIYRFDQ